MMKLIAHLFFIHSNMSRILFAFFFIIQFANAYSTNHIRFMGLSVTGDIDQFKDSLVIKGFSYIDSYESSYKFFGKFANEIVTLTVLASPDTKTVCKIIVDFPQKSDWKDLKKDYFTKKDLFKSKYPMDSSYEFFSSPYEDGDGYELRAVSREKCTYTSFFLAVGGYIIIEIEKTAQIRVTYEDRENMKIAQEELKQSAIDDI